MKLSDYKWTETDVPKGVQIVLNFGKYELSIIQNETSYGSHNGLFEIGVFKDGSMKELPGITNPDTTVKGFLTENEVSSIIKKMYTITGVQPTQV